MRITSIAAIIVSISLCCFAQNSADDTPATKADIERYFQVAKSHDMMKKVMANMAQNMHQIFHDQYLRHKDKLPADYETKINSMMDGMFADMPMDDMLKATIPAYQKHFTKGDVDNLVAFYQSPTGDKLLRELPEIMAEAMQEMMPIMTKYMTTVEEKLQKETDTMIAQSKKQSTQEAPAVKN